MMPIIQNYIMIICKLNGFVPRDIWSGEKAEMQCLEFQISFLEEIGAPEHEIEYAKSLRGTNCWDAPRSW